MVLSAGQVPRRWEIRGDASGARVRSDGCGAHRILLGMPAGSGGPGQLPGLGSCFSAIKSFPQRVQPQEN